MKDVKVNIQVDSNADKATKSLEGLEKEVKKLQEAYKKTAIGSEEFKKLGKELDTATDKLSSHQKGLSSTGEAYKKLGGAIPMLAKAQEALNLVMAANPVGLVVAALVGLVAIMKQNAEIADMLEFAMAGVNKAIRFVADQIVQLLKNIKNFDLSAIIDQITGFHKGLAGAAVEGYKAAEAQDALAEQIAKTNLAITKNNNAIEKSKTLLKDKTKSDNERKEAAKEIIRLEDLNASMVVKNAKAELQAYNLSKKGLSLKGEELAKQYELQSQVSKAEGDAENAKRAATIRLNALLESEGKASVKIVGNTQEEIQKLKDEYLLNERQKIEKKYADDLIIAGKDVALQKGILDAKKIALDEYDAKIAKMKQDEIDAEYKTKEDRVKADVEAETNATNQLIQNMTNQSALKLEYKMTDAQIDTDFENLRLSNSTLTDEQIYKSLEQRYKKEKEAGIKAVEDDKKNQQKKFDKAREITNAVAGLGNALADIIGVNAKKGSEAEKKAAKTRFNVNKAAGMASAGINVAEAITKAIAAGPGYGQAMAIVAAATGAIQLAAIAAKQFNPESGSTPDTTIATPAAAPLPDGGGGPGAPGAGQSFDLGLNAILKGPEYNMQRVYVTETDISRVQGRVKVVETRSTLN